MLLPARALLLVSVALLAGRASAGGSIINVPGDQPTIQAAIVASASQDTILVAPGTYAEAIDVPQSKTFTLESTGGPEVTVIDGGGAATVFGIGLAAKKFAHVTLKGFTLRNGGTILSCTGTSNTVDVQDCVIRDGTGPAAVDLAGTAIRSLAGCVVTENAGIGIRCEQTTFDAFKVVPVSGSTISHNGGNGVEGKWMKLTGCTIEANGGAGAWLTRNGEIVDCTVIGNAGSGAQADDVSGTLFAGNGGWGLEGKSENGASFVLVDDCRFLGNGAGGAWLESFDSHAPSNSVRRCIFANGDGLFSKASNTGGETSTGHHLVQQCSIDGGAGLRFVMGTDVTLLNTILRGTGIVTTLPVTITYSDIEGGAAGVGNIDADPLWADPQANDFAPLPGSPCINTGDPGLQAQDPDFSNIDIGAVPYDPWTELGTGLPGLAGVAQLAGSGSMVGGATIGLQLSGAPASTPVALFLGIAQLGAPLKGGTLWPVPLIVIPGLPTTIDGTLSLSGTWPAGLPSGTSFWTQLWWSDAGGPAGVASTNGLKGTQP